MSSGAVGESAYERFNDDDFNIAVNYRIGFFPFVGFFTFFFISLFNR